MGTDWQTRFGNCLGILGSYLAALERLSKSAVEEVVELCVVAESRSKSSFPERFKWREFRTSFRFDVWKFLWLGELGRLETA